MESVPANTVNSVIKNIEEQVVLGFEQLALFKQEAEMLRQETDALMNERSAAALALCTEIATVWESRSTAKKNMKL